MTEKQWLEERKNGIGGSDAATILGLNPYKTNIQLWEEKTRRKEAEDISDKPYVKYRTSSWRIFKRFIQIRFSKIWSKAWRIFNNKTS